MSSYINREEVLRIIDSYIETDMIAADIRRLPFVEKSEDSERKNGQWVPQKGGGYCCSECYVLAKIDGNFIHVSAKTDYCPYCGSRMKGEK